MDIFFGYSSPQYVTFKGCVVGYNNNDKWNCCAFERFTTKWNPIQICPTWAVMNVNFKMFSTMSTKLEMAVVMKSPRWILLIKMKNQESIKLGIVWHHRDFIETSWVRQECGEIDAKYIKKHSNIKFHAISMSDDDH